jgi:hypothetical protein
MALATALLLGACQADEALPLPAASSSLHAPAAAPARPMSGPTRTACELASYLVDETLGVETVHAGRPVSGSRARSRGEGCRLVAVGSFDDLPDDADTPVDMLFDAFDEGGWFEDARYASDTDESSALGMWRDGILCVMGAVWVAPDEYADADYEPTEEELRYDLTVECVPAKVPPIPLWGATT